MKCRVWVVFLSSSLLSLNAMQTERLRCEECPVTFQIQIPLPARKTPEKQVDMSNKQAIVGYLQTLRDINEIPLSMYDFIINEASGIDISDTLSNVLLRLWGINPDILVSGKDDLIKGIGATLSDVKSIQ